MSLLNEEEAKTRTANSEISHLRFAAEQTTGDNSGLRRDIAILEEELGM
jgi:hypothetical protein